MFVKEDPKFLRRRAEEERTRAEQAADLGAKLAHQQLAELFTKEAEQADGRPSLRLEP